MNPRTETRLTVRITLEGAHPPVWRELAVDGELRLLELHDAIVIAFGWTGALPHIFTEEPVPDPHSERGLPGLSEATGVRDSLVRIRAQRTALPRLVEEPHRPAAWREPDDYDDYPWYPPRTDERAWRTGLALSRSDHLLHHEYGYGARNDGEPAEEDREFRDHTITLRGEQEVAAGSPRVALIGAEGRIPAEGDGAILGALADPAAGVLVHELAVRFGPGLGGGRSGLGGRIGLDGERSPVTGAMLDRLFERLTVTDRRFLRAGLYPIGILHAASVDADAAARMVRPVLRLLETAADAGGIPLADAGPLAGDLKALGLLRQFRGALVLRSHERRLLGDPPALWHELARRIPRLADTRHGVRRPPVIARLALELAGGDPDIGPSDGDEGYGDRKAVAETWAAVERARRLLAALGVLAGEDAPVRALTGDARQFALAMLQS